MPELYAATLKCVSRDTGLWLRAARFTAGYVRLVVQEPAPGKCVLVSTSSVVRNDMRDGLLSHEEGKWTVKLDVRDLGGHQDTTFVGWSATLAAGVRLVISRLVPISVLLLDFHGRLRVIRSLFVPGVCTALRARSLLRVVCFGCVQLFLG